MICATNTIVDEDEAFIRAFEDATLAPENFRHRDHIRLAWLSWLYLQNYTVPETLTRYSRGIENFARANGKENLYHETITWAFIFLVEERMESSPDRNMDWETFAEENSDLLNWQDSILSRYYRTEVLFSSLARRTFILPESFSG